MQPPPPSALAFDGAAAALLPPAVAAAAAAVAVSAAVLELPASQETTKDTIIKRYHYSIDAIKMVLLAAN